MDAPKWQALAFLLETLMDADNGVSMCASRLIERWIENFNRNQIQPTPNQVQRVGALLDSVASRLPEDTARKLRCISKPL